MLMRSLSLAGMIWLFAETQQEMRLLASDWLATPAIYDPILMATVTDFAFRLMCNFEKGLDCSNLTSVF